MLLSSKLWKRRKKPPPYSENSNCPTNEAQFFCKLVRTYCSIKASLNVLSLFFLFFFHVLSLFCLPEVQMDSLISSEKKKYLCLD